MHELTKWQHATAGKLVCNKCVVGEPAYCLRNIVDVLMYVCACSKVGSDLELHRAAIEPTTTTTTATNSRAGPATGCSLGWLAGW